MSKRAAAIAKGEDAPYRPMNPFDQYIHWKGTSRLGIRYYGKVKEFVILINLTALGNKIIKLARQIWNMVKTIDVSAWMTIRAIFSIQGAGNPFYPQSFEPTDQKFTFAPRGTEVITEPHEIERQVRSILSDAWEIAQEHLIFFEHFEIVKSVPRIQPLPKKS
jgi:hypothetical protein